MRLSTFILTNMEAILQEWEDFAKTIHASIHRMTAKELRDHAEAMLRDVAADLETYQARQEGIDKSQGLGPQAPEDMFMGGFIAARSVNSDRVVAWAMACGAVLLAVCGLGVLGAQATMVVLAATGFAVGIGGPSRDMMIKKATPPGATGRVYGMVYSGLDTGFAISPLLFGVFMDRGWYGATLLGAAFFLLLSVGAAVGVGYRTAPSRRG